jgi:chromosome segregation ATPase
METTKRQTHRASSPQEPWPWQPERAKGNLRGPVASVGNEFLGFGAAPPKRKQQQQQQQDDNLLKDAERLIQIVLGNSNEKLSKEAIDKVIQRHAASQTKKRYSTLLEKPWRTTPEKWEPDCRKEASESHAYERTTQFEGKSPKMFRRTSFDGGCTSRGSSMYPDSNERRNSASSTNGDSSWMTETGLVEVAALASQLDRSKQALEKANQRIASLQQEVSVLFQATESEDEPSINDNLCYEDDESDDRPVKRQEMKQSMYGAPKHTFGGEGRLDNEICRTMPAKVSATEILQNEIAVLKKQLVDTEAKLKDTDERKSRELQALVDAMDQQVDNLDAKLKYRVERKDKELQVKVGVMEKLLAELEAKLKNAEAQKAIKSSEMQSKIVALEEELVYSEAKLKDKEEEESALSKEMQAKIESLERQLANCEVKLRETENQTTVVETMQRLQDTENLLKQMDKEIDASKIEVAVANAAAESAERKLKQLDDMHNKLFEEMQGQLTKAENKTKFLHEELSNLMPLTTEMAQVRLNLQIAQTKLKKSEQTVALLQANEEATKQAAVDVHEAAEARITALEESLTAANERSRDAVRRLEDLEAAQAREQEILSEELRESETTIACLMEELDLLKPLQETRAVIEVKEQEILDLAQETQELRAALTISDAEVEELRHELSLLMPLIADLGNAEQEVHEIRSKLAVLVESGDVHELQASLQSAEQEVDELQNELDLLKPLASDLENAELELHETRAKLELKEQQIADMAENSAVQELQASLQSAEREVEELQNELNLLRPLASAPENAERELHGIRAKPELKEREIADIAKNSDVQELRALLQSAEQEVEVLRNELTLLKPQAIDLERDLHETRANLEIKEQEIAAMAENSDVQELHASLQSAEQEKEVLQNELNLLKPLASNLESAERELQEIQAKLELKEREISEMAENDAVQELQASLQSAEQEAEVLRNELTLLKPLASDLEKAERELHNALAKLELKEREITDLPNIDDVKELRATLQSAERKVYDLTNELDMLKPLASDLEVAERELHEARAEIELKKQEIAGMPSGEDFQELRAALRVSETDVAKLHNEMKLLKPLASDLEHVQQELDEVREKLEYSEQQIADSVGRDNDVKELRASLRSAEQEVSYLRKDLFASHEVNKVTEQLVIELKNDHNTGLANLREQLDEANAHSASLQKEIDYLQITIKVAEDEITLLSSKLSATSDINAQVQHLQLLLDRKEREIESLNVKVAEQEKQITSTRMQVVEMDEERNYNRAKMMELSSLIDVRNRGEPEKRLHEKTMECEELIAERDNLKQKLNAVEVMANSLEPDNKQKKAMVQELMSRYGDSSSSTEAFIESLQKEQERTLKRCADLSLQLAESQFKIDELTGKLRKTQFKAPPLSERRYSSLERSMSYCVSPTRTTESRGTAFKAMLNSGIDRLNTCLDDSLRAVDEKKPSLRRANKSNVV